MLAKACAEFSPNWPQCYCVADAIFTHDSAWMTAGVGKWALNPGNLRCMGDNSPFDHECVASPGNGYFAKFSSREIGIRANVEMLSRKYAGKSPYSITKTWAQTESKEYHNAVNSCFY